VVVVSVWMQTPYNIWTPGGHLAPAEAH